MANEYVNKVVQGSTTLIDLTGDTITASDLAYGVTAHDRSGAPITGSSTKDSDTSDATATASEILATKTAYVAGSKVTGSMPNIGKQTILIQNLNLEYWPQWFAIKGEGHFATEAVPNQWNGQINYTMNRGGSSLPNVTDHFWADGSGHNFQSRNNLHKKICSSEERRSYYPNYGQEVFDTTLNKWLICTDPANKTWRDALGSVIIDE